MKKWLLLVAAGGLLLAWKAVDAQGFARRGSDPGRQTGNVVAQGGAVPEPGTIALFASGAAPVVLYLLRRHRDTK